MIAWPLLCTPVHENLRRPGLVRGMYDSACTLVCCPCSYEPKLPSHQANPAGRTVQKVVQQLLRVSLLPVGLRGSTTITPLQSPSIFRNEQRETVPRSMMLQVLKRLSSHQHIPMSLIKVPCIICHVSTRHAPKKNQQCSRSVLAMLLGHRSSLASFKHHYSLVSSRPLSCREPDAMMDND